MLSPVRWNRSLAPPAGTPPSSTAATAECAFWLRDEDVMILQSLFSCDDGGDNAPLPNDMLLPQSPIATSELVPIDTSGRSAPEFPRSDTSYPSAPMPSSSAFFAVYQPWSSQATCTANGVAQTDDHISSKTRSSARRGVGRICMADGCTKNSQSRGLCIRHGGGKRCAVAGCPRGAQARGTCKAHGGGVRCKVPGCTRSSQGAGRCRTHGGGRLCDFPGCTKGTQRQGKCSTHGGARRCQVPNCTKIDRGGGFCGAHRRQLHEALA